MRWSGGEGRKKLLNYSSGESFATIHETVKKVIGNSKTKKLTVFLYINNILYIVTI